MEKSRSVSIQYYMTDYMAEHNLSHWCCLFGTRAMRINCAQEHQLWASRERHSTVLGYSRWLS